MKGRMEMTMLGSGLRAYRVVVGACSAAKDEEERLEEVEFGRPRQEVGSRELGLFDVLV